MWTDNASKIDMLFYKPYADIISETAINTDDDPLTIGVFGLWGAGKSTLLNMLQESYNDSSDVICVSINAWMFENYEDAKIAVMEALLQELDEKAPAELKKFFKTLLKKIDFLKVGTKVASTAAPVIASLVTGNPVPLILNLPSEAKEIETTIKSVSDSVRGIKENYMKDEIPVSESTVGNVRAFRKEFEQALSSNEIKRVVVLLDDLDRCQPERIIETLEAIKLFLSVKKTTFIIAADDNVIQYAIKKKYPNVDGFNVELDKEYIEKMIQLPIQIPELSSKDVQNYLLLLVLQMYMEKENFESLIKNIESNKIMVNSNVLELKQMEDLYGSINDSISFEKREEYKEVVDVILQIREIASHTLKGNPRQVKRFLNTFIIKRKLSLIYYGNDLNMGIMAKLLILHKLSPDLFNQLSVWNASFNMDSDVGNEQYKLMRQGMDDNISDSPYHKWYKARIKDWINCPPIELEKENLDRYFYLTREILNHIDDLENNLSEESKKILDRINSVTQGIAPGIVEDMKKLSPNDLEEVMTIILKRIRKGNVEPFLYSLIFVEFSDFRKDICDAIIDDDCNIEAGHFTALKSMFSKDETLISAFIDKLLEKKRIKKSIVSKIKGSE